MLPAAEMGEKRVGRQCVGEIALTAACYQQFSAHFGTMVEYQAVVCLEVRGSKETGCTTSNDDDIVHMHSLAESLSCVLVTVVVCSKL